MKLPTLLTGMWLFSAAVVTAAEPAPDDNLAKHHEGAVKVANDQDELAADVQQLVIEQTMPKVIALLNEVQDIMGEATDHLAKADTGGDTIAAQTEVIEKIHAAAKEKQDQGQGSGSKSGGAMMDMMERMMGKKPGDEQKGQGKGDKGDKPGDKPGDQAGKGQTGESDTANAASGGAATGKSEARRVPKAAGNASAELPEEFKKAFDAYNRGAEKKIK